jgi:PAS domain S-box-containing protein
VRACPSLPPSPPGLSVYFRNVTDRKRADQERERLHEEQERLLAELRRVNERQGESLAASEERFRLLVEGVQDYAIFLLDPQGNVVTWNAGAERFKGYKAQEILGRHFSTFYTTEDIARRHPWNELEIAEREGRYEEEGWRVRKDGGRFWASVVITALRDASGDLKGFGKVTRDMTERRERERERVERERQSHIAERLQSALRPTLPGTVPGLEMEVHYQPAFDELVVGGDFFDVFGVEKGCYALVVADLSGKGLEAAAQTATVRHMLSALL